MADCDGAGNQQTTFDKDEKVLSVKCFTNKKEEPNPEVYREYFLRLGEIEGKFDSRLAKNETWYFTFNFSCEHKCWEGKHKINGTEVNVRFGNDYTENRNIEGISPYQSPLKKAKLSSPTRPESTPLSDELKAAMDFLVKMRSYGLQKKARDWKQFAVIAILVTPSELESTITYPTDLTNIEEYIAVAVPSSYTASLDDVGDTPKNVVHAECKLLGDPGRHPHKLCVPYDRSALSAIVEKHRMQAWEESRELPLVNDRLFLYSEIGICKDCMEAIRKSVFHFSQKYNDLKPIVGHSMEKADETKVVSYKQYGMQFMNGLARDLNGFDS